MKTRIFLFLILLAIVAMVVVKLIPEKNFKLSGADKPRNFQTVLIQETELISDQVIEGELAPSVTKKITFEVGGILAKGDALMKKGQEFKFNELLMRIEMYEIFGQVSDLKRSMEQTLRELIPAIRLRFPDEVMKWKDFMTGLDKGKRLPPFPLLASTEEGDLLRSTNFLKEYVKASKLEEEVGKYFYLAPFDGIVVSISKQSGSNVKPGEIIGEIAKKGTYVVQLEIALQPGTKAADAIDFLNIKNDVVGSGKLIGMRGDKALYSFSGNGGFPKDGKVYVKIRKVLNCFRIPTSSIKENNVRLLFGNTVTQRLVTILKEVGDSVYVDGLKEGEILILR